MNHQRGNLLDEVKTGIILQQVNAQGVMGSGIAKDIREKWPKVWEVYSNTVTAGSSDYTAQSMGMVIPVLVEPGLFVVNLVAQQFYGKDCKRYTSYDALDNCLREVAKLNKTDNLPIHHPLLGCGLGGGDWDIVSAIVERHLGTTTTLWTPD
jgi:O-acetyl-ADP-ribose deacetylase (regulator of RNase III)